ncbi:protein rolling stone-like [Melitaea cinxia]|uniref:protein rolling stone-like n=1 Tax=Melitaea cinxia TaxID=113334 RepID=UPI001E27287D|nr:protein rolling stone-like [Melitaea cinxia]
MVKKLKNAFSISDLWVSSNEKTSDYYLTSWQRGDSAIPMFLVRLLLSSVSVGILVWSLVVGAGPHWMIYLTNWGLLLVTSLTLSGLLVSCFAICKKIPDGGNLPWYVSIYWLCYNITITIAIMITALYWILLFSPELKAEQTAGAFWLDVATHGFNSCLALAELLLSRTPMRFLHIYQPLGMGVWYAGFSAIYYSAGGTDGMGNPFIYEILDWSQADRAGVIVAISAASLIILYTVLWFLTLARDKLSVSLIRTTSLPLTPPELHSPDVV